MREETTEKELLHRWSSEKDDSASDGEFTNNALLYQLLKISMFEEKVMGAKLVRYNRIFKVAAVLICGIFLSSAVYFLNERSVETKDLGYINSVTVTANIGELKTATLPDGTEVTLNSMSSIIYPEIFCGTRREVVLIGEAYFDVVKDKSKPFIVKTNKMEVEALGTSFEVSAYNFLNDVSATLNSGSIKVSPTGLSSHNVIIEPNQRAVIRDGSSDIDVSSVIAKNRVSWKDGVLIFEESELSDVFTSISKRYGIDVFCNKDKYNKIRINATILKDMDIDETMRVLSEIGNFKYSRNGLQYIIK